MTNLRLGWYGWRWWSSWGLIRDCMIPGRTVLDLGPVFLRWGLWLPYGETYLFGTHEDEDM